MPKVLLFILAGIGLALAACQQPEPLKPYDNPEYNIRFVPQRGWTVSESVNPDCLLTVECFKDPDCRFRICVSQPKPDILMADNAFVACENIKSYVQNQLKGQNPACGPDRIAGRQAFNAMYFRLIQGRDRVRVQFVDHEFVPMAGRLVQVMAYSLGDSEDLARQAFEAHKEELLRMMASIWMR